MAKYRKTLPQMAKPGDLLFYRVTPKSSILSRLIASAQLLMGRGERPVQYSHVAILERDGMRCIEARWPKVQVNDVNWEDPELELWRYPMSATLAALVLINARDHFGDYYDIGQLLFGWFDFKHAEICTTLVRSAFARVDLMLGAGSGKFPTPNDLVSDPALEFIGRVGDE